ncbi:MAG: aminotransferase class V-fold PLP-dependent enzyme [Firmicutes bacterium]|nr:aminotransferase class V-fold PLP-dependent enzyme [Bacillota bacterium]
MIYLDYAAHTPPDLAVLQEFLEIEKNYIANPISNHKHGWLAKEKFAEINEILTKLFSADEIIFTSGATEANNLAIRGLPKTQNRHIISSCLEHPSVHAPLATLQEQGYDVDLVDILPNGTINLQHLVQLLRNDTILLTVPWVDSELGAIQPIAEISDILEDYPNCFFHVDAAQAVGKFPIKMTPQISTLSFSPHKFYGLVGVGVLLKRKDVVLNQQIIGGKSMSDYRGGTPTLAMAASTCTALNLATTEMLPRQNKVEKLRNIIVETFSEYPQMRINSPLDGSPYILNASVNGVKGTDFQEYLNNLGENGACISVKSACSAVGTISRPVFAVSKNKKNALSSWRLSFSHLTTIDEIIEFLSILKKFLAAW